MNETKIAAFSERLAHETNGALSLLNLWLGLKLGLFSTNCAKWAMRIPQANSAARTQCQERYVREWLECMYAGEYVEYDAAKERFSLSPEYAAVLLDETHPAFNASSIYALPDLGGIMPMLADAFQKGGGVPYEAYGEGMRKSISMGDRPLYVNDYASKWIPAMPDVEQKFRAADAWRKSDAARVGRAFRWRKDFRTRILTA